MSAESSTDASDDDYDTVDDPTPSDGRAFLDPSIRQFPWVAGALTGAATFLIEYLLVGLLFVLGPISSGADVVMDRLTIWAFTLFGAHLVPIVRSAEGVTLTGPARVNVVTDATDPVIPAVVYLAIPVLALLAAGALFEWWRRDSGEGVVEGSAIVGAGLAVGYVVVGMVATFLFVISVTLDQGSGSETVDRIFGFAALLGYPLIVGSIGALLVRGYRDYVA